MINKYVEGFRGGWMSANEIRELENLNPLPQLVGESGAESIIPMAQIKEIQKVCSYCGGLKEPKKECDSCGSPPEVK